MVPHAITSTARYEFALETPPRERTWRARAQLALKRFVLGAPEDAFVAMTASRRGLAHLTIVALFTFPLALAEAADGESSALSRVALLFIVLAGVALAARLERVHQRPRPIVDFLGGLLLAIAIVCVLSLAARAALPLPFVEARHALALVVLALAALSVRGDPRACVFAGGVGALALVAFASERGELAAFAPELAIVGAAGIASTLSARRRRSLAQLAIRDPASGALHEAAFADCLTAAGERARAAQQPLSVARIELAALDRIRRTHGEMLACALTGWLARVIADRFRTTDLLGRVHVDAFALALIDADHPGLARRFEQLRDELAIIALVKDGQREPIALELAVGLAALPREAPDPTSALKLAEQRAGLARWRTQHAA